MREHLTMLLETRTHLPFDVARCRCDVIGLALLIQDEIPGELLVWW